MKSPATLAALALLALSFPNGATAATKKHLQQSRLRHGAIEVQDQSQEDDQSRDDHLQGMAKTFPFYHNTEKIKSELRRLAKTCKGMTLETKQGSAGGERAIDVVTIKATGSKVVNKNFLLFGEHARELISPESGLYFVKSLCGETSESDKARQVLQENEFQIVVNGNPGSRRQVEAGNFCLRVNPNGVDLNRNWDEEWDPDSFMPDANPGPKPFSESETQIFKQLTSAYRPDTFLTIHSGTKGLYMPWAYDMEHLAQRNRVQMMNLLQDLDEDHCQCPFGAAGKEVGYSCPGTCLDWVYAKLNTSYAFAFEIYIGGPGKEEELRQRWQAKVKSLEAANGQSYLQSNRSLADAHFKDLFEEHPSSFVQLRSQKDRRGDQDEQFNCFYLFNPSTKEKYDKVVSNWASAYLDVALMVTDDLKKGGNKQKVTV